jgi:hypothetical protein
LGISSKWGYLISSKREVLYHGCEEPTGVKKGIVNIVEKGPQDTNIFTKGKKSD